MSSTLRIFRKDVRHLWPRIVLVGAIEVAAHLAASAPWLGIARLQTGMGMGTVEALAQWFLIASAILEEPLVGDRQYWLTRPYSWKSLLAAKLLFGLVFINLPVLAADGGALILRGLSPMGRLPGLAVAQFFILEKVLGGLALASISASLVELVLIWLVASVGVTFAGLIFTLVGFAFGIGVEALWGSLEWVHGAAIAAFWVLGGAAILAFQYRTRNVALSRWIVAAGVPAFALMIMMPGWHAAFALQSRLGPRRVANSVVRIDVDSERALETGPLNRSGRGRSPDAVEVPVLVTGIPPGMGLQSDRVAAAGVTPDGGAWTAAWDSINRLSQPSRDRSGNWETRVFTGDGPYWLYFNVDRSLESPERTLPGRTRATAALTLLSAEEITPLHTGGRPTRLPQGGLCWMTGKQSLDVTCSWPAPMPGYAVVRILSNGTPAGFDIPLLSALEFGSVSYGPCSNAGGLWQVAHTSGETHSEPSEIVLVTRRVVAHFERGVDIYRAGGWPLR
jgi:hypothetical protein